MKINLKARLKNKTFVVTMSMLIISLIYQILALCDVVPKISEDTVTQCVAIVVNLLASLGVLVDPTTDGLSDSNRAMTYYTDEDARNDEVVG